MSCFLMMEAGSTSETSVNFYQTTRRNIPEDSHFILAAVRTWDLTEKCGVFFAVRTEFLNAI
jgi:hypothetical protein